MKALPYIGIAAVAALLAWTIEHNRMSAELAAVRLENAEVLRRLAEDNADELERVTRRADLLQQQVADIDAHYTQEIIDEKVKSDALRDAVDAGNKRLLILGKRPASCPTVPTATDGASVGDGATIELSPVAQRAYFNLRAGLTNDTNKLLACQAILAAGTQRVD